MKKTTNSSPYQFEGRIPLSQAIPLGLQHVMAMFIGNLTPLIIVMGACGLTADAGFAELRTALLQNAMIIAGIVTLVQMFSIGPVGGKVPIVMGTSSGFLKAFAQVFPGNRYRLSCYSNRTFTPWSGNQLLLWWNRQK